MLERRASQFFSFISTYTALGHYLCLGDWQDLNPLKFNFFFLPGLVGRSLGNSENLNSYAGSISGIIYYLNENGSCMEVLQAEGAVKYLLHYQQNDRIIVITESMVIGQFQVQMTQSSISVNAHKNMAEVNQSLGWYSPISISTFFLW